MFNRLAAVIKTTVFFCVIFVLSIYCSSYAQSAPPRKLMASNKGGSIILTWQAPQSGTPVQYYVYKAYSAGMKANMSSLRFMKADSTTSTNFKDNLSSLPQSISSVIYYVTAVNTGGTESPPSNYAHVVVKMNHTSSY